MSTARVSRSVAAFVDVRLTVSHIANRSVVIVIDCGAKDKCAYFSVQSTEHDLLFTRPMRSEGMAVAGTGTMLPISSRYLMCMRTQIPD